MTEVIRHIGNASRREHLRELVLESQTFAEEALHLEELLSEPSTTDSREISEVITRLPAPLQNKYVLAVDAYRTLANNAARLTDNIEDLVQSRMELGISEIAAKLEATRMLFKSVSGDVEPIGKVEITIREGYVCLLCEDKRDIKNAYVKPWHKDKEQLPSGFFCQGVNVPMLGYNGPIIFIDATGGSDEVKKIFLHERQHFINHNVFDLFEATEPRIGGTMYRTRNLRTAYRGIKDEVLAYMREASENMDFVERLSSSSYKKLFEPLSEAGRETAQDMLADITEAIRALRNVRNKERTFAILTYQLVGVPLQKIPDRIWHIAEAMHQRAASM